MIAEYAQDLVTKLKTIPAFGTTVKRVGVAVGAREIDPTLEKVERPAAWVIFVGDEPISSGNPCASSLKLNFVVKVLLDYGTESELIAAQFPLLEELISTVSGKEGPLMAKWKYEGQMIDELTKDRMVFDQRYSIVAVV